MELEALRKQLSEEIASQFDAKLRDAKRQKSEIEEEFEQSSEKWRTERRRLNSEIDRLEAALAEARQSGRESAEARPDLAVDPQEIAKLQAAADEKIKEAALVWEKERTRLLAEISRLQEGIAELIERTNNPLRANPNERGKQEAKYDEAVRAKRQAEEALLKSKSEWEAEKLTLAGELTKLRQAPAPALTGAPRKVDEQLEKRLQEANRLHDGLVADLEKARHELSRLKETHAAELQNMSARLLAAKTEWEAEKVTLLNEVTTLREAPAPAPVKVDDQLEKRLQEANRLHDGLAADLEKARHELSQLKEAHAAELQNNTARLLTAKTEWEAEKVTLLNEVTTLREAPAPAPVKVDDQLEKRLQEANRLHDGLAADLEKARHELSQLKEAHAAELQNSTARLLTAKTEWEAEKVTLLNEVTTLRQAPAPAPPPATAPRKADDQLEKRLQETIRLRDGLAADFEKARHEIAKLKETHSAELQDFTSRYIQTRSDLEKQLRESEEARTRLEKDLEKAREAQAQQDGAMSEEVTRLTNELEEATKENTQLKDRLTETKDLVSADVINDLQRQFDARMQEIILENTQLSEKVRSAASQLDGEARSMATPSGSGNNGSSVSTLDSAAIDEEVQRVQTLAVELAKLIDDPETELATVIRKNVERAALEAYMKGMLFSLGRGKKL